MGSAESSIVTHVGGCHCGAVRFEVDAPRDLEVHECNCSMCSMTGYQHLIVSASRFRLKRGKTVLSVYRFNTGVARHLFCSICGVKSFYVPRSNPDGFSVNLRCLDTGTLGSVRLVPFDGRNWERNAASLRHLSQE